MHHASTEAESLRAAAECMDVVREALKQMPADEKQVLVLYDLDDAGYNNLDLTFAQALINGLEQEFPGALEKVHVFNGHWTIKTAWSAIELLLSAQAVERVTFHSDDYQDKLLKYVPADHPYLRYLKKKQSSSKSKKGYLW
jgi:hypothetical protein